MAIQRAPKGGAYGANGEWYEGGKFIATTKHPKRHGSYKPTGKVEIEPYVWAQRREGLRPIYGAIFDCIKTDGGQFEYLEQAAAAKIRMHGDNDKTRMSILRGRLHVSMFNAGYRWFELKDDGELTYHH